MRRFNLLLMCLLGTTCAFRVMNFNLNYQSYVNSAITKIAHHIKAQNPDIVTIQEKGTAGLDSLLKALGHQWSGIHHCNSHTGVITRHEILGLYEHTKYGMNARIRQNHTGFEVSVWSMYLHEGQYNFYNNNGTKLDISKKLDAEVRNRVPDVVQLLKHPSFVSQIKNADNVPIIVAGCFNSPSHLDWIDSTNGRHNGAVIDWPVTKLFTNASGMTDSYREYHPNPLTNPGFTWSVYSIHKGFKIEKDRIDYIFYRGSLKPTWSTTYSGTTPVEDTANWKNNEWPTDHWAVVTDFERTAHKGQKSPSFYINPEYNKASFNAIDKCPVKIIQ